MNREDESLLVDFVLGRCEEDAARRVQRRLKEEPEFALTHQSIVRTLETLSLLPPAQPPDNLVESTMMRVRAMRQSEVLASAPPLRRRAWTPTFTLRELTALAAMAVVAIGILVPVVSKSRERTQRELCQANQGQVGIALAAYSNENNDFLPTAKTDSAQWLSKAGSAASNSSALFQLVAKNLAKPEAFQCPAAGGQSFVAQAGMVDFPHPRTISYSYQHSLKSAIRRSDAAVANYQHDFAIMADATPVFHNGQFDPVCAKGGTSRNHGNGQNVLYLDNTVRWSENCNVGVSGNNIWLVDGVYDYKGDEAPNSPTDSFLLPNPGQ